MKKVLLALLAIVIVALFGGTIYYLYQKSEEKPVVFETDAPFKADIVKKTIASGTINPRKLVNQKPQVSGVIEKIYVEEGEHVKKGDLIAKIKIVPNVVQVNNAQANLQTARIQFENAGKELKRQKELFEAKVISEFDYNQFLVDYRLREQEVTAAENNLELVLEGSTKRAGNVTTNLVKATVDGMVLSIPVKEGTFIIESNSFNEGTTIATIADMNEMIFEGKIDESEVGRIKPGMDLLLTAGAIENQVFDAKLEFISPKGESEDGAIKFNLRAAIKLRDDQFLRAGYSATADIVLEKREQVLAIRESNLLFEGEKIFVEIAKGNQEFEKREIKTGLSDGINIQILEGLAESELIKKL
jgi:HlyD family secretion protein